MGKSDSDAGAVQRVPWEALVEGRLGRFVTVKLATGRQFCATSAERPATRFTPSGTTVAVAGDQAIVTAKSHTEVTTRQTRIQGSTRREDVATSVDD
jgi:hypothetical protein